MTTLSLSALDKSVSKKAEKSLQSGGVPYWSDRIDRFIGYFKWPAAWCAALVTPFLLWALLRLLVRSLSDPIPLIPFALGVAAFLLLWRRWLGDSRLGRLLITLEHESTHALFAMLTLHRIVGFRASIGRGGEVRFIGKGNWLITVAPYFFPTAALLLFLVAFFLPFPGLPWQSFLLGVALGYHIVSTKRETHRDQSDIKQLGKTFCWMFLPAANLLAVGLLISFSHAGSEGMRLWLSEIFEPVSNVSDWLIAFFATADNPNLPTEDSLSSFE